MTDKTIYFIGGGTMASAIIGGLQRLADPPAMVVCDPSETARLRHEDSGLPTVKSLADIKQAEVAVLGFKPQHFAGAISDLNRALDQESLVVSMMVGVSCKTMEAALPTARIVRIMPNTPMRIGEGMSGVAPGSRAKNSDLALAARICEASGKVLRVSEDRLDALAAVSGSGPAYFFTFCEALMEAAQQICGFTEEESRLLVSQTAKGAIAYLTSQEDFPAAQLRIDVTSKGGTTEAALKVWNAKLGDLAKEAMKAALNRAAELDGTSA